MASSSFISESDFKVINKRKNTVVPMPQTLTSPRKTEATGAAGEKADDLRRKNDFNPSSNSHL